MIYEYSRYDVGQRFRRGRLAADLTQIELAERMGVSVNFISEIENGKKGFSTEVLYRYCQECDMSADDILFGNKPDKSEYDTLIEICNNMNSNELITLRDYLKALIKMKEHK